MYSRQALKTLRASSSPLFLRFFLGAAAIRSLAAPAMVVTALGAISLCGGQASARRSDATAGAPATRASLHLAAEGACLAPFESRQIAVEPGSGANSAVTWYIDAVPNGNAAVGTISAEGLYTAPEQPGSHTIQAVSQADRSASAMTRIDVSASSGFVVAPGSATVPKAGRQAFQGMACGVPSANVTWAVDGIPGGNATVGTINSSGEYSAPSTDGSHTITATDVSTGVTSEATTNVSSDISVNFGSRDYKAHPIRSGVLGVNHVDWLLSQSDMGIISRAGLTLSRTFANIPLVYATKTPNWSQIDPKISELRAEGFHVLMQLAYTPTWLQKSPNPCSSGDTQTAPTNVATWAQLAKSIVAHMDATFPGVVTDYEIWNEPDSGGLCGDADRLSNYLAIYAAAAPLLKKQAAADGKTIRVGGPAGSSMSQSWITALTTGASTAPYVDFVSYHNYVGGLSTINDTWDTYNGYTPLYTLTQSTTTGPAYFYAYASRLVGAGKQPLGAGTPIYVDEYNSNWAFDKDCCRDSPTYAPIWNALYVIDLLDTVYSGTSHVPGQLTYYTANNHPNFCLLGDWDSNMDCDLSSTAAPTPYPQYYAYELMASSSYLGLNSGGYMASSVSPLASGSGLAVSAFYTGDRDSILIVNPTGSIFSETVNASYAGFGTPMATLYEVVGGKAINTTSLSLSHSGATYSAKISIPAYTALGIAIKEK
jgi:hypothetical protein